jgi:hypothetical protein
MIKEHMTVGRIAVKRPKRFGNINDRQTIGIVDAYPFIIKSFSNVLVVFAIKEA